MTKKKLLSLLLCLVMCITLLPTVAFADGGVCDSCNEYHYLCDCGLCYECGGECSEGRDHACLECHLAEGYACEGCGYCYLDNYDWCTECLLCPDCGDSDWCDECGLHAYCSEYHCEGCGVCFLETYAFCDECVLCPDCGDSDWCDVCLKHADCSDELHCEDCNACGSETYICESCSLCMDCGGSAHCPNCESCEDDVIICPECEEVCSECAEWCDNCGVCLICAVSHYGHCPNCEACGDDAYICPECGEVCSECAEWCDGHEMCWECAVSEGLHCPNCEECSEYAYICPVCEAVCSDCADWCDAHEMCWECAISEDLHCPSCEECSEYVTMCIDCGNYCSDCTEICEYCYCCPDCVDSNTYHCPKCNKCFEGEVEKCPNSDFCIECCDCDDSDHPVPVDPPVSNTYTVTFDMKGHGLSYKPADQQIAEGKYASKPEKTPVESGWLFDYWYKDPECTVRFNFSGVQINENTTVYAKWTQTDTYFVRVNARDDKGKYGAGGQVMLWEDGKALPYWVTTHTIQAVPKDTILTFMAKPNKGYEFVAWVEFYGEAVVSTDSEFTRSANGAHDYIAVFKQITHTITTTVEGGIGGRISHGQDSEFVPNTEARVKFMPNEGYVIERVTINDKAIDLSLIVNNQMKVTMNEDKNVVVTYKSNAPVPTTYTVTYDANGGTGTMEPETCTIDAEKGYADYVFPACGFTAPEGKEFDCWTVEGITGSISPQTRHALFGDMTVKAVWKDSTAPQPTTYTVSFDMNGHGTQTADQTVNEGDKATKPTDPAASGWTFDGWYADATFSVAFDFNTAINADTTIYAKWTQNIAPPATTYTVSFNMNGHGTQVADQTVNEGAKATKPTDPTASGWTFDGWYVDATFSAAFDFNTAINADTTIYAKWTKNTTPPTTTYTIIAGANGEWTKGSTTGLAFTSDAPFDKFDSVKVDGSTIAATNYTAEAGSTKITLAPAYLETMSVGSHSIVVVSTDGTASTSFTVKAAEQPPVPTNYIVSFDMNGHGEQISAQSVESGSKATKPADPKASGYTFGGWYADATCSTKFDFNSAITANTTVYAKWTKNSVAPTDPTTPQTGDNSNMFLWIALLFVSGGALVGTAVYGKKKKYRAE